MYINFIYINSKDKMEVCKMSEVEILNLIHNDLGVIACLLIFFIMVTILKYIYKFFDMLFHF